MISSPSRPSANICMPSTTSSAASSSAGRSASGSLEQQPSHRQIGDQHGADAEGRGAEHAEEAQRLLREAHQEEDAEQVEHVVRVFARPIDARVAVLRRLAHGDSLTRKPSRVARIGMKRC